MNKIIKICEQNLVQNILGQTLGKNPRSFEPIISKLTLDLSFGQNSKKNKASICLLRSKEFCTVSEPEHRNFWTSRKLILVELHKTTKFFDFVGCMFAHKVSNFETSSLIWLTLKLLSISPKFLLMFFRPHDMRVILNANFSPFLSLSQSF